MDLLSDDDDPPVAAGVLRVALEEPVEGQVHTGVGNLRGWAVASEGITKVEILIDGALAFEAPYGGERGDVGGAFPDVAGSSESGFSLAYNYSGLAAGPHTITAVAYNALGEVQESSARFEVVRFESPFIADPNAVDLNSGSCTVASDEISIIELGNPNHVEDLLILVQLNHMVHRFAFGGSRKVRQFIHLEPIHLASIREEQERVVSSSHKEAFYKVIFPD